MQNKFFGSKFNSILLLILIVLMIIAIHIMFKNKEAYFPTPEIPKENPSTIPDPTPIPLPQTRTVTLGEEFTIQLDEKVSVADSYKGIFKLTGFYNHPCPPNAQCIWSGLDVFYQMNLPEIKNADGDIVQYNQIFTKDKPLQDTTGMPYQVIVKDSDYKTYAKIVLFNTDQYLLD